MRTDLERDLREVLAAKHEAVRTSPIPPRDVLARARRREVSTVLVSVVGTLALLIGVIGGVQALQKRDPGQNLGEERSVAPLPSEGPEPGETSLLLASGEHDGQRWTLRVTSDPSAGGLGLAFEYEGIGGGGSGLDPIRGARVFQSYGGSSSPSYPGNDASRPPLPREITGQVVVDAARVELRLERGPTLEATIYPLPEELIGPAKVFLLFVPGGTLLLAGDLIAYDASGNEIGREYLDISPVSLFPKVLEESPPDVVAVMKDLQLAGAVVGRYYDTHGSFSGLDPDAASAISSELVFNTSDVATPGEVSLRVSGPNAIVLASVTGDGQIYSACASIWPGIVYGRNDTGDPYACTNGWLDLSAPTLESHSVPIASGSDANGNLWSLTLVPTGDQVELALLIATIGSYMPLEPLGGADLGSIAAVAPTDTPADAPPVAGLPTSVYGLASGRVASVELRTQDGRTFEGTLFSVPPGSIDASQVFLFLVPVDGPMSGTVVAFDAAGNELQREETTTIR